MQHKRPLSPHLQIYKPQLTTVLSITHRATGICLALGALLFALWLVSVAAGAQSYYAFMILLNSWFGQVALMGLTFCLFYHLANGIRHLFWDTGRGFSLPVAYFSGWIVVTSSIILTIALWIFK